jgi:hypothetical protein
VIAQLEAHGALTATSASSSVGVLRLDDSDPCRAVVHPQFGKLARNIDAVLLFSLSVLC